MSITNPIFPKQRGEFGDPRIGDRVKIIKTGRIGTVDDIYTRMWSDVPLLKIWNDGYGGSTHDVSIRDVIVIGRKKSSSDNPIYKKRRYVSKFKIGDRVAVTGLSGGPRVGKVTKIFEPDNIDMEHSYNVEYPNGAWSQFYEGKLEFATPEHEAEAKKRESEQINIGDVVTVTSGHAAGSSGEVVSDYVANMFGYIRIRTLSGRLYDVHTRHVVKTSPRPGGYTQNPPVKWGAWPAEDPPVGEVVIDSHPTSERHGTTATVVKKGKSTTWQDIYLLKFGDGFERWYTSLQIRRMPGRLKWRSIRENPDEEEPTEWIGKTPAPSRSYPLYFYPKFSVGQRVRIVGTGAPQFYGLVGDVVAVEKSPKGSHIFYRVKTREGIITVEEPNLEGKAMLPNPIFEKRREFPRMSLRDKLINSTIFSGYSPRTGQIKLFERSRQGFKVLHVWDDPPGDLGEWMSYLERAEGPTGRERVVDQVIEQLKQHLPADVLARVSP